jgi:hypothetical protein
LSVIVLLICLVFPSPAHSQTYNRANEWPKFGLVYQKVQNFAVAAQRYWFSINFPHSEQIIKMAQDNPRGVYAMHYNLIKTDKPSSGFDAPDYNFIASHHPEWIFRYKDGSPVLWGPGKYSGPRLDFGNPQYVIYVIDWMKRKIIEDQVQNYFSLDTAMFAWADKHWQKYDTDASYQDAWEFFLRSLSQAFRPQKKIILNVGRSDLPTFKRMIRWVDGILYEGLCTPLYEPQFTAAKARVEIKERWEKAEWCEQNGKVYAVQSHGTVQGLALTVLPGSAAHSISVNDQGLTILGTNLRVLGQIDFSSPASHTLAQVAKELQKYQIQAKVLTPWYEASVLQAFRPLTQVQLSTKPILRLKQAPRESFLFGYAAILMVAGPNSYFIFKGETGKDYYYPEMDWPVGAPKGEMREIAPQVYRRDFQYISAFLNLSDKPFRLSQSQTLPSFRGALLPVGK